MPDLAVIPLEHLDVLSIRGPDARSFLQGQLSQDMAALADARPQLAGLHDPQGRCLAVLRLFALEGEQILAVLPRELMGAITTHLRRYLLRSRVKLEPATSQWFAYGVLGPDAESAASTRQHMAMGATGLRQLILAPRLEPMPEADLLTEQVWQWQDISDGLPQVFAATSGMFTAQMLNLDLVQAVSFSKGCYTGQEIIARTHYLGKVKRRMRRFHTAAETSLVPGSVLSLADGRRVHIVNAAPAEGGGREFLAIAQPPQTGTDPTAEGAGTGRALPAIELPLPYALDS